MNIHESWRNGQECMRAVEVEDGLSINVLLPLYYWSLLDNLIEEDWDMPGCIRACWTDTLDYDGPAIEGGQYETFRRYLVQAILLYDDGRKAVTEGRANDNMEHKAYLWNGRQGTGRAVSFK